MRRRKINADASLKAAQAMQWLVANQVTDRAVERPAGECRYCGRQIGRGLHKHERKCANDHARNNEG